LKVLAARCRGYLQILKRGKRRGEIWGNNQFRKDRRPRKIQNPKPNPGGGRESERGAGREGRREGEGATKRGGNRNREPKKE
jgi:hypothetical protein